MDLFSNSPEVPEDGTGDIPQMANHTLVAMPEDIPATQPKGQTTQEPAKKPVDWEKRYKDLQSYTDRKLSESNRKIEEAQARYRELDALESHIKANPDLINVLEASLTGRPIQPQQNQMTPQVQMPQKPENFDPMEIYDPSTPSGRWYATLQEAQQQKLVSSITSEVDRRFKALEAQQQAMRQEEIRRRQSQEVQEKFDRFFQSRDFTPEEKDEFLEFVQKGPQRQPTLDDLYAWHAIMKGTQQQGTPDVDIDSRIKQAKNGAPPPITSIGSQSADQLTEDQLFSRALLEGGRKKWTFK